MVQRDLLFREITSLQTAHETPKAAPKPVKGHVAWAKGALNRLTGNALPDDNKADDVFRKAVTQFQQSNGVAPSGRIDFKTERLLLEKDALARLSMFAFAQRATLAQAATRIEDWTDKAIIPDKKKHLILQKFRDPRTLTALVLHHMAYKAKDKKGNFSNPETYVKVGAHFCIMMDGRIMQHHPVSRFIWHSNDTSPLSVGVEFEGNFPNEKGKWWYQKDEKGKPIKINEDLPTAAQYDSGRFLLQYLKLIFNLRHVLAHRQSSATRPGDPGPDIWYNVGEWGLKNLGIQDGGKDFKVGDGATIPDSWRIQR